MLAGRNVMKADDGLVADQWICQELLFSNPVDNLDVLPGSKDVVTDLFNSDRKLNSLIRKSVSVDRKFARINP